MSFESSIFWIQDLHFIYIYMPCKCFSQSGLSFIFKAVSLEEQNGGEETNRWLDSVFIELAKKFIWVFP